MISKNPFKEIKQKKSRIWEEEELLECTHNWGQAARSAVTFWNRSSVRGVTALAPALIFWSDLTWMAFKSKYHMAYVTSRDTAVIKIHYAGVRRYWDAARHAASFGRLKIWRLKERLHYTVVILNNLFSLASSPSLMNNACDPHLARMLSRCERV